MQRENDILINQIRNEYKRDFVAQSIGNQSDTPCFYTDFTQIPHKNMSDFQRKVLQKTIRQRQREIRDNHRKTDAKFQMKVQLQKMCSNFNRCFVVEGGSKNNETAQKNREKYVAFFKEASEVLNKEYKIVFDKRCMSKGKILENDRAIKEIK